jgi:hypothetical protein
MQDDRDRSAFAIQPKDVEPGGLSCTARQEPENTKIKKTEVEVSERRFSTLSACIFPQY